MPTRFWPASALAMSGYVTSGRVAWSSSCSWERAVMRERKKRLRRVELAVPASNERMMAKAAGSNADMVFVDLGDAVGPKGKVEARAKAVEALKSLDWSGKTRCVRINDLGTEWAFEDIITVVEGAHQHLDVIMIPKVMRGSDVLFVDTLLGQLEKKLRMDRRIGLEVLIEEVEAMINVEEIARSSPRLEALIYGVGDFSASQGIDLGAMYGPSGYPGDTWHYRRQQITIAARTAGINAGDRPSRHFKDAGTPSGGE